MLGALLDLIVLVIFLYVFSVFSMGKKENRENKEKKHVHYEDRNGKFIQNDPHDSEGYDCNKNEEEIDPITRYK